MNSEIHRQDAKPAKENKNGTADGRRWSPISSRAEWSRKESWISDLRTRPF